MNVPKLTVVLSDIFSDEGDESTCPSVEVELEINPQNVSITSGGYGDAIEGKGGIIALLENNDGILRLVVWSDINNDEPTHVIDLSGAKEERRHKVK